MEFGHKEAEEYDQEMPEAAAVLLSLRYGGCRTKGKRSEEYDQEMLEAAAVLLSLRYWGCRTKGKRSPRKRHTFWDSRDVILDEGCGMQGGEVRGLQDEKEEVPLKKRKSRDSTDMILDEGCGTQGGEVRGLHDEKEEVSRKKPKSRDSTDVILDEGCSMQGGEVPGWVEAKVREFGGSQPRLVVQKKLYNSDVTSGQSRFSIPMGKIAQRFLTEGESALLDQGQKIDVSLIQPCGKTSELLLGKWRLSSSSSYVLTKNWTSVWKEPMNGLEEGKEVQLWSYRVEGKLYLWLVNMSATSTDDPAAGPSPQAKNQ